MIFSNQWEGRPPGRSSFLIGLIFVFFTLSSAAEWSMNSSLEFSRGNFIYDSHTSTYFLNTGLRYRTSKFNVSVNVPVVFQNSDLVNSSGNLFLPHHRDNDNQNTGVNHHGRGRMDDMHFSNFKGNLGDILLFGEILVTEERTFFPSVSAATSIKFPTGSVERNFSSGEWDIGASLAFRKKFARWLFFADAGYLILGDPTEFEYRDPFTLGAGLGHFFQNGKLSAMIYYQTYTRILGNYAPPRQVNLGIYFQSTTRLLLSFTAFKGLSELTPDFGLSTGLDWNF